jgi:hypothetical protein
MGAQDWRNFVRHNAFHLGTVPDSSRLFSAACLKGVFLRQYTRGRLDRGNEKELQVREKQECAHFYVDKLMKTQGACKFYTS